MTNEERSVPGPEEMIEAWRKAAAGAEQQWNDYFNQLMGTESFGQMMARSMESYITMQSTVARGMEQYLRSLNFPSRTDIVNLAERVAMLEQKIDAIAMSLAAEPLSHDITGDAAPAKRKRKKKSGDSKPLG
ncbi:MAG: hypothetical protein AB7R89_15220 [Dehalococcoidia bacterium]